MTPLTTRFAPSPTGALHLGHAHAALFAWTAAKRQGGRFLLRIEDIDRTRCRPEFEQAIFEDLAWIGLEWEQPVWRQSARFDTYAAALKQLEAAQMLYPCFGSRAEIAAEIAAAGEAPHEDAGARYPGTCRRRSAEERARLIAAGRSYAIRLDAAAATTATGALTFTDYG